MIIISISKKLINLILLIILVLSLGYNIYNHLHNLELTGKYKALICIANQFGKTNQIEIFNIDKGEVIKKMQTSSTIQKIVEGYINNISGMYSKVKAFPAEGYIIKIPLEPPIKINNHWLNDYNVDYVKEIFILFPEMGTPYLLILDNEYRPLFYNLDDNTDILLSAIGFTI